MTHGDRPVPGHRLSRMHARLFHHNRRQHNEAALKTMGRRLGVAALSLAIAALVSTLPIVRASEPPKHKKLIEWGWDEPDTRFLRAHIEQMEKLPFDGVIFHVAGDHNENLCWDIWSDRRFAITQFQHSLA